MSAIEIQHQVFSLIDGDNVTIEDAIESFSELSGIEKNQVESAVYQ